MKMLNMQGKIQKTDLLFLYKPFSIKKSGTKAKKINKAKKENVGGQLIKKNKPEIIECRKYLFIKNYI